MKAKFKLYLPKNNYISAMEWRQLLISLRTGHSTYEHEHSRSEFQRDYDRIIFSAAFRRLQNKTQVFPLPGSVFVHNRLTHSIEVSSVGRSIGHNVSQRLSASEPELSELLEGISPVVSAGCLAHDMGNPPFGHSGEKAIQHFFANGDGKDALADMSQAEAQDFLNFDGNANTFRLLSHSFRGRREGGYALTYPTLASIIKYPRSSEGVKKFGFFQQDKETFRSIMTTLGVPEKADGSFARHPLVYLVEAADDISYQAMDVEDAYRLGILDYDETRDLMLAFFDRKDDARIYETYEKVCRRVGDRHEQIAYLRSVLIGKLVSRATDLFCDNIDAILAGEYSGSLIGNMDGVQGEAMGRMATLAAEKIYRHQTVAQIELSGFAIIGTLIKTFMSVLRDQESYYAKLVLPFIPEQYRAEPDATTYEKALSAVDTISGMTDIYALDLYKKITGNVI